MKKTLEDDLKELRINFHWKLARKREIEVTQDEVIQLIDKMDDSEVQNHIKSQQKVGRWLNLISLWGK